MLIIYQMDIISCVVEPVNVYSVKGLRVVYFTLLHTCTRRHIVIANRSYSIEKYYAKPNHTWCFFLTCLASPFPPSCQLEGVLQSCEEPMCFFLFLLLLQTQIFSLSVWFIIVLNCTTVLNCLTQIVK